MSIKHALLVLLLDGPGSASQLQSRFADSTSGVWPLNMGQVTQTLGRLQRDGHIELAGTVTGVTGHSAETYTLTESGHQVIENWFNSPVIQPLAERDELVAKVSLAVRRRDVNLIRLLDSQREAIMSDLRRLNRHARDLPDTRTTDRLLTERRILDLESQARWLDRVESLDTPEDSEEKK
ncbi:helix-turn-helix transcriptional regulator [Corynebacterium pacaense]|uniref:helix-turn-helix transcriptional regulator n=1 Tax=Corynebacterium pacaense TaxID=1816684 RepID=UPI0009BA425D|nr:helix-turn-helix transcriptional regulator [Corynebacterium pacaense]